MANDESKFSTQMLRGLKNPGEMTETPAAPEIEQPAAETVRASGTERPARIFEEPKARKMGKTRDPEYKRLMVLVRKKTEKDAGRKWQDEEPEQDFSDLVERLLKAYADGRISA